MTSLIRFVLLITIALSIGSCTKEDPTYPFSILVTSEDGTPMPNVSVTATADVANSIANFTGITDENGRVAFEYSAEAVLKVIATRGNNPTSWLGCGYIQLEADRNVTTTVVLLPYDPSKPGC